MLKELLNRDACVVGVLSPTNEFTAIDATDIVCIRMTYKDGGIIEKQLERECYLNPGDTLKVTFRAGYRALVSLEHKT